MPIVFEQPSPMGYSPAAGAQGTVDQTNKNIQFLLDAARNRGGGGGTGGAGMAAQQATTQAWSRANQNQTDLEYQGQLQQQAMAQQSAQQQAAMQQNADQFTFADQLQLQKYQAGLSQLNQSLANGELTQQEFQEGLSQYTGVISPLQTKAQAAKQKMLQQQYETMTQQGALESAQVKTAMQMLSGSQNGLTPVYDDDNKLVGFASYDSKTGNPKLNQLKPGALPADPFAVGATGGTGSKASSSGAGGAMDDVDGKSEHDLLLGLMKNNTDPVAGGVDMDKVAQQFEQARGVLENARQRAAQNKRVRLASDYVTQHTLPDDFDYSKAPKDVRDNLVRGLSILSDQPAPTSAQAAAKQLSAFSKVWKDPNAAPAWAKQRIVDLNSVINPGSATGPDGAGGGNRNLLTDRLGGETKSQEANPPPSQGVQPQPETISYLDSAGAERSLTGIRGQDFNVDDDGNVSVRKTFSNMTGKERKDAINRHVDRQVGRVKGAWVSGVQFATPAWLQNWIDTGVAPPGVQRLKGLTQ